MKLPFEPQKDALLSDMQQNPRSGVCSVAFCDEMLVFLGCHVLCFIRVEGLWFWCPGLRLMRFGVRLGVSITGGFLLGSAHKSHKP